MLLDVEPKQTQHIKRTSILQQSDYWARVKQAHGYRTEAFDLKLEEEEKKKVKRAGKKHSLITDDVLFVIKPVSAEHDMAYVPYGPVLEPEAQFQGQYLEELSESLRPMLPPSCIFIRYDLDWESPWSNDEDRYDEQQNWLGPPPPHLQELRFNFGTQEQNLRKATSDVLPSNTIFIDLQQSEAALLQRMKPKTRYNIRVAKRKGVTVSSVDFEQLPVWYAMHKETALRNGIIFDDIEYFQAVLQAKSQGSANVHLLLAQAEGEPLAGMFLAISGERATYLYGASASHKRNFMATYALQWEAIRIAKAAGCTEYDMFGVSRNPDPAHPMYGLYRFKTGFGGDLYHRQGCWDYPLEEAQYEVFRTMEMNASGFHVR